MPCNVSEWDLSGLTPVPAHTWGEFGPPRVAESAFSLECDLHDTLELHDDDGSLVTTMVVGRVRCYAVNKGKTVVMVWEGKLN